MSLWKKTAKLDPNLTVADLQALANANNVQAAPSKDMLGQELNDLGEMSATQQGVARNIRNEYDANMELSGAEKAALALDLNNDGSIEVGSELTSFTEALENAQRNEAPDLADDRKPEPEISYNDAWSINDDR